MEETPTGRKVHSEVQLSFNPLYQLLTHPLCPDSKTLFQSRIGGVNSVYSNICPPKLSHEIHKPPQLWGHTFAGTTRSESFAFATGTNWSTRQATGCRRPWYPAIWGPCFPRPAVEAGEGFFFQSLVELHMVEIKGVAGCMVLLYFQALLLIRKQDQRQY